MSLRIVHLADLHLKHKHPFTPMVEGEVWDRLCEEKLNALSVAFSYARRKNADLITIGGDVFDTSNPPEALKAAFCELLNSVPNDIVVKIIPGRPGDHDFVSSNNYVLMDLREAYRNVTNIEIYDKPYCEVCDGVLLAHLMLDGISSFYKKTVAYDDDMFAGYNTILLGDYHAWYKKKFAKSIYLYPGCPYPTRYGEHCHHIAAVDVDSKGRVESIKKVSIPTYKLLELHSLEADIPSTDQKLVIKYKITAPSSEIGNTLSALQNLKIKAMKDSGILDVVWELKSQDAEQIRKEVGKRSLRETCLDYIDQKAPKPKTAAKFFKKMEAQS